MPKSILSNKRGVVLYMVLASILVAVVFATAILHLILSQARFSHHEVSRVQAYYAALAGANYAFENLRSGAKPACWPTSGTYTNYICKTGGTDACATPDPDCDLTDNNLPRSVSQVTISVGGTGPGGTLKINSKATYTYTEP